MIWTPNHSCKESRLPHNCQVSVWASLQSGGAVNWIATQRHGLRPLFVTSHNAGDQSPSWGARLVLPRPSVDLWELWRSDLYKESFQCQAVHLDPNVKWIEGGTSSSQTDLFPWNMTCQHPHPFQQHFMLFPAWLTMRQRKDCFPLNPLPKDSVAAALSSYLPSGNCSLGEKMWF